MTTQKALSKLRQLLLDNRHEGYNLGAVILDKRGCILNWGFNSYIKTHPAMVFNRYYRVEQIFVHAECDAIYSMSDKVTPYTMIIARINQRGDFLCAKPCVGCYSEIQKRGIKQVFYTEQDGSLTKLDLSVDIDFY